jgi:hypothetical protein
MDYTEQTPQAMALPSTDHPGKPLKNSTERRIIFNIASKRSIQTPIKN